MKCDASFDPFNCFHIILFVNVHSVNVHSVNVHSVNHAHNSVVFIHFIFCIPNILCSLKTEVRIYMHIVFLTMLSVISIKISSTD